MFSVDVAGMVQRIDDTPTPLPGEVQAVGLRGGRGLTRRPVRAPSDVATPEAPGHAVGAREVLAIVAQTVSFDAEAVQPEAERVEALHDPGYLSRGLPSADRADADERLRGQVNASAYVLVDAAEVVADPPSLENWDDRQVRRQLLELEEVLHRPALVSLDG